MASIRQAGLLPACELVARHGAPAALLHDNRARLDELSPGISLRRQGMSDHALTPRLDAAITTSAWRRFINGLVFFYAAQDAAERMRRAEPGRDQVVLQVQDRRHPGCRRRAHDMQLQQRVYRPGAAGERAAAPFDDYRPASEWDGAPA